MEANVWPNGQVAKMITQDQVLIQLYVDDKTDLAVADQKITPEGRIINTIDKKWSYF